MKSPLRTSIVLLLLALAIALVERSQTAWGQRPLIPPAESLGVPPNNRPRASQTGTSQSPLQQFPHPPVPEESNREVAPRSGRGVVLDNSTHRLLERKIANARSVEELKWWLQVESASSPTEISEQLNLLYGEVAAEQASHQERNPQRADLADRSPIIQAANRTTRPLIQPQGAPPYQPQSESQLQPLPDSARQPRPQSLIPTQSTADYERPLPYLPAYPSETQPTPPPSSLRFDDSTRRADRPLSASSSPPTASVVDRQQSVYLQDELRRLVTLLETELAGSRGGTGTLTESQKRQHIRLRLLYLLAGQNQQALDVIPGLPRDEQEFWQNYFWSLANELEAPGTGGRSEQSARTAALVDVAHRHLREMTRLETKNVCFCQKINSFGNYDRFLRDEFQPGQPLLIYAELKNFRSELSIDGTYRTRIRTIIEIVPVESDSTATSEGTLTNGPLTSAEPVDRRDFPATEDVCRSIRHDYFNSYRIDLPPGLSAGRYVIRLNIHDEIGSKRAIEEIPFSIR